MTTKPISLALALGLAVSTFAAAQTKSEDGNASMDARTKFAANVQAQRIFNQILANKQALAAPGDVCAIAVIPGPADNENIRIAILNIATDFSQIGDLTVDGFGALGGQGMPFQTCFSPDAPAGGTIALRYPGSSPADVPGGRGPAVMSFTGFNQTDSTSFNLDPDTFDNPNFTATVNDMTGTVLELAFVGGKRCRGMFTFNAVLNASLALPVQVNP
jgi:hypothetical protein